MPRFILAAIIVAAGIAALWRFPLFHVVPLKDAEDRRRAAAFDASKFADAFWKDRLTPALPEAADAAAVLARLAADADAARQEFGRTVGISRSTFFFVRGRGTIVAVEPARIGVALDGGQATQLWLATGPVHGNAVRDATGLIRNQDFSDSQDFNALAAALNAIVEQRVQPELRDGAKVGRVVEFVACGEVLGGAVRQPLRFTPVAVRFE